MEEALRAVDPHLLVRNALQIRGSRLIIRKQSYSLDRFDRIFLLGAGKAAGKMAEELMAILGTRISTGIIIVPHQLEKSINVKGIMVEGAGHPFPDRTGVLATKRILDLVEGLREKDLVFFLLSGGASSLMPAPVEGVSLEEKIAVTRMLMQAGASIDELNAVRKHLSMVKGGKLGARLHPATVIGLVISDVPGDDLNVIGSGPTVRDCGTTINAVKVLKKFDLWSRTPTSIRKTLLSGKRDSRVGHRFRNIRNFIIGNNLSACRAAMRFLLTRGVRCCLLSSGLEGEARDAGNFLGSICQEAGMRRIMRPPFALIWGGETTVTVQGKGVGGRNQEVVLGACKKLEASGSNAFASMGSDGVDGNSDAAGAMADEHTFRRAGSLHLDPDLFLLDNNSYKFFQNLGDLVFTGPTGTNVGDVGVMVGL